MGWPTFFIMEMNWWKSVRGERVKACHQFFDWLFRFLDNDQRKTEWSYESSVGLFESDEWPEKKCVESSNIHVLVSFVVDTLIGFHNESDDEAVANRLVRRPNSL